MPETVLGFDVPTLPELQEQAKDDLNYYLPGEDARLPRSEPYALAHVTAAVAEGAYGFERYLANQILVDRATGEWLDRHGAIWGVTRLEALQASGSFDVTGTNGTLVPDGTLWQSVDGEKTWAQTADVTIAGGVGVVPVEAVEAGTVGNADAGTIAIVATPIAGLDSEATASSPDGVSGGRDLEGDEDYRARILERIRDTPQGGAEADYVAWARLAPTSTPVDQVWVNANEPANGYVTVRFSVSLPETGGTAADAVPTPGDGAIVLAAIEAPGRKPVTANVVVIEPTAQAIDYTIELYPDQPSVRAEVEAELDAMSIRRSSAEDGSKNDTLHLSQISEAISAAAGEEWHVLSVPAADVTIDPDKLPTVGTITWV